MSAASHTYYMRRLYDFLDALSRNNNRPWFNEHKPEYLELRALWLADIDAMIRHMSEWMPELAGQTAAQCVYRIYRDTRFSNDKTPYKTHFSAAVSPWGRKAMRAGFYIETGSEAGYDPDQGLYAGIWCIDSAILKKMRHAIVDNIEEWQEIVNSPEMLRFWPGWCSSTLRTIPKGWDRNHPQAEYLRMTNYGKQVLLPRSFFMDPAWPEKAADRFRVVYPMVRFINYSIEE